MSATAARRPAESLVGRRVKLYLDSTRRVWSLVDPATRRVIGKADQVILRDCRMVVSAKGRRRVVQLGRKFPHAYVEGRVSDVVPTFGAKGRRFGYSPYHPCGRFPTLDDKYAVTASAVAAFAIKDGKPLCWAYNAVTETLT